MCNLKASFKEAKTYCESKSMGLLAIDSNAESKAVNTFLNKKGYKQ
jgi:hypothetical protein